MSQAVAETAGTGETAVQSHRAGDRTHDTTLRTLRLLRLGLLAAAVAVLLATLVISIGLRGTATSVRTQTAPSIIDLTAAQAALVAADTAVITSFRTGEVRLAGPGAEFQSQMAVASQSLARAAENNIAGEPASRDIQLVQGLLVAYLGLVGQADAHYRQEGDALLGFSYLWQASRMLHAEGSGVLHHLDELRTDTEEILAAQVETGWTAPVVALVWTVPLLALAVLLGATLRFLSRRFRRTLNLPLLAATGLCLVVAGAAAFSLVADRQLAAARDSLATASSAADAASEAIAEDGRATLELMRIDCAERPESCDPEGQDDTGASENEQGQDSTSAGEHEQSQDRTDDSEGALSQGSTGAGDHTAAASRAAAVVLVAPLAAAGIGLLVMVGLHPRIDEYRFRPR